MEQLTFGMVIAIVIGLAEVLKKLGVNTKVIPAVNLVLGLLGVWLFSHVAPMPWPETIMRGLVAGLTASGLYSGVKNVAEGITGA